MRHSRRDCALGKPGVQLLSHVRRAPPPVPTTQLVVAGPAPLLFRRQARDPKSALRRCSQDRILVLIRGGPGSRARPAHIRCALASDSAPKQKSAAINRRLRSKWAHRLIATKQRQGAEFNLNRHPHRRLRREANVHVQLGLLIEPRPRVEYRQQAERNRESGHHEILSRNGQRTIHIFGYPSAQLSHELKFSPGSRCASSPAMRHSRRAVRTSGTTASPSNQSHHPHPA